jgi:hypothetical protein
MQLAGYVVLQYSLRMSKPLQVHELGMDQISEADRGVHVAPEASALTSRIRLEARAAATS